MLVNELKKFKQDIRDERYTAWEGGIILFCPANQIIYKISFGDGSDDEPIDGCDDYLYITEDKFDEDGFLVEGIDGGNMWFRRSDYAGVINEVKLIKNALQFMECPDVNGCIFISQFN